MWNFHFHRVFHPASFSYPATVPLNASDSHINQNAFFVTPNTEKISLISSPFYSQRAVGAILRNSYLPSSPSYSIFHLLQLYARKMWIKTFHFTLTIPCIDLFAPRAHSTLNSNCCKIYALNNSTPRRAHLEWRPHAKHLYIKFK